MNNFKELENFKEIEKIFLEDWETFKEKLDKRWDYTLIPWRKVEVDKWLENPNIPNTSIFFSNLFDMPNFAKECQKLWF